MKNEKGNMMVAKIISEIDANSVNAEKLIPMFKELREMAKEEQDPLLTRSIRLVYEHLEANNGWEYQTLEDSDEIEENLIYLVSLYAKSDNKYNRDELREIANTMTNG